jgi:non-reducing end alpha-L-arabinofuranosidase
VKQFTSCAQRLRSRSWRSVLALIAIVCLIAGAFGVAGISARAAGSLPCDIYASGGTPCVAAHSTVRALYSAYNGNLYQVKRASDNTTLNIGLLSVGGYANAAAQDSFCAGTSCVITIIYDQSGRNNNLTVAPAGGYVKTPDSPANASALSLTVAGHKVYGVYLPPRTGYRDDTATGTATGDNPEGEYAVVDDTHYNNGCCFDYGNAEKTNNNDGNGTMETIYFGNANYSGTGSGPGPWVMSDQENGLWAAGYPGKNSADLTLTSHYVTAIVNGGPNHWAIKAGNAQSGGLTTMWDGTRQAGYNPMRKEGAIVLGVGGDNSNGGIGTFFEGAMTSGYPSAATDNAIQASIVTAGYGSSVGGPTPTPTPTGGTTPTPTSGSYEAESSANTLGGRAVVVACTVCSGGLKVGNVGKGGTLQFNNIQVSSSGTHTLTFSYIDGDAGRTAQMSINGGAATTVTFHGTNNGNWNALQSMTISVQLKAGSNTILFSNASAAAPDFDRITVS